MRDDTKTVIIFIAALVALHLSAFVLPGSLTWGFHFLTFLGPLYLAAYLACVALLLLLMLRKDLPDRGITFAASAMERRPALFLLAAAGVFIGAGLLFRLGVPLLGDSWFLVKNFSQVLSGTEPLYPRNEPLSTYYYSGISALLGVSSYADFLSAFFVADMIMGVGFVVALFFIVRELLPEGPGRFTAYLLVLSLPSTYLFFGYVETYAPVCFAMSLFILAGLVYLRGGVPFTVVMALFLLQLFTHYLTLLLLPSLLFLAYRGFRRGQGVDVLTGLSIGCVLVFGSLLVSGASVRDLYSQVPHSHVLPLAVPAGDLETYSFQYTLFSPFHFADLGNLVILLAPSSLFLCLSAFLGGRGRPGAQKIPMPPGAGFLCLGVAPIVLFACAAKFDLGMARDWDVTAPFAFLFALAAMSYYLRVTPEGRWIRVTGLLAGITLCNSLFWFAVNARDDAALDRFHTLLDSRFVSQEGIYGGHLSLAMFHHQTGVGRVPPVDLWEGYITDYPGDIRGYVNVMRNMKDSSVGPLRLRIDRWIGAYRDRGEIMKQLLAACFEEGNLSMEAGLPERARVLYDAALGIDPGFAPAWNNLGILSARLGDIAGAAEMFEKTIGLDSNYTEAYFNLGRAYLGTGKRELADRAFREAARRGNAEARAYLERGGITPPE